MDGFEGFVENLAGGEALGSWRAILTANDLLFFLLTANPSPLTYLCLCSAPRSVEFPFPPGRISFTLRRVSHIPKISHGVLSTF